MFIRVKLDQNNDIPLSSKLIGHVFKTEDTLNLMGYLSIDTNSVCNNLSSKYRIYEGEFELVDEEEAMKYAFEYVFGIEPEYETKLEDALGRIKHLEKRINELQL